MHRVFIFLLPSMIFLLALVVPTASPAAGTQSLAVTATVLSKSNCKFSTATALLNFGALDPANNVDVTSSTSLQFVCRGSAPVAAFVFTSNDGLYETGPGANRMRHASVFTEFLPYALSFTPASGTAPKGVTQTLTITGKVTAPNYRSAMAGNYADTVVISIVP